MIHGFLFLCCRYFFISLQILLVLPETILWESLVAHFHFRGQKTKGHGDKALTTCTAHLVCGVSLASFFLLCSDFPTSALREGLNFILSASPLRNIQSPLHNNPRFRSDKVLRGFIVWTLDLLVFFMIQSLQVSENNIFKNLFFWTQYYIYFLFAALLPKLSVLVPPCSVTSVVSDSLQPSGL